MGETKLCLGIRLNSVYNAPDLAIHGELVLQAPNDDCREQNLMAFDVKGNSQLLAKYVRRCLPSEFRYSHTSLTLKTFSILLELHIFAFIRS